MRRLFGVMLLSITLTSCSSIKSIDSPSAEDSDGLIYFMPMKDFVISVVKANDKITNVTFAVTEAYPDTSRPFTLRHSLNWVGKNTLNVSVDVKGLLVSSKSTTVSGLPAIAQSLGTIAGTTAGLGGAEAVAPPGPKVVDTCPKDGTQTFILRNPITAPISTLCGLTVSVEAIPVRLTGARVGSNKSAGEAYSGIFYRQADPFLIAVNGAYVASAIVFSPSTAPIRFLPVSKTLFSDNAADFAFTDGMPTKYDQDTDGEVVALLKLPADIVGAYFAAVGKVFDAFKSRDASNSEELLASLKLQLARQNYDACVVAIKAKDSDAISKLGCGK